GMSTALHLVQLDPTWAGRLVVIDRAVHPRPKLCGGGVTQLGEAVLTGLGLPFEPAHVPVREVRLVFGETTFAVRDEPVFRVVRRDEFDYWLVRCGQRQGITVRQGEAATAITPQAGYVEVVTGQATFHAQVVVAADGSRSLVRQKLNWDDGHRLARLLEVLTPEAPEQQLEFREGVAVFDFNSMAEHLQGYYWDFPSLINGRPFMNRGVFDSRARPERPRAALKDTLRRALARRGRHLEEYPLSGHPLHWFDPTGRFSQPRVLLVGDAAGVDPLLGEGISFALAYGEVAAAAIAAAFSRQDFSFADYKSRILAHHTLSHLHMRARLARLAYRFNYPWLVRLFWRFTPLIVRALARYQRDYVPVREPRLVKIPG
ncbi:MAG: FAD-dependent monooxygenase, partial [Chloroflexota bacterium]